MSMITQTPKEKFIELEGLNEAIYALHSPGILKKNSFQQVNLIKTVFPNWPFPVSFCESVFLVFRAAPWEAFWQLFWKADLNSPSSHPAKETTKADKHGFKDTWGIHFPQSNVLYVFRGHSIYGRFVDKGKLECLSHCLIRIDKLCNGNLW